VSVDWQKVVEYGTYIVLGVGGWFAGRAKRGAETKAEVAQSNKDAEIADAEGALYRRLREDLDALRGDVNRLRAELDSERTHGRKLERHVWKLEGLMRKAGLEPPPFEDEVKVGGTI
jgi:hypothetical protein